MRVNFSVEELVILRDAVSREHVALKKQVSDYKGEVKEILDTRLDLLEAFHQRLVGVVVAAEAEKTKDE